MTRADPKNIKRIGVLTSGGDAPGLNAVIRAVVITASRQYGWDVVGIHKGFEGLLEDSDVTIKPLSLKQVIGILNLVVGLMNLI